MAQASREPEAVTGQVPGHLPPEVQTFVQCLLDQKMTRLECRGCPLRTKPMVVLDLLNCAGFGPVDVYFMALNPGREEVVQWRPLVGPAGGEFHALRNAYIPTASAVLTNLFLCHTANQAEVPDVASVASRCRGLTRQIASRFTPRIWIPLGSPAAHAFGITGPITQACGKVVHKKGATILPLVHPSSLFHRRNHFLPLLEQGFQTLQELLAA